MHGAEMCWALFELFCKRCEAPHMSSQHTKDIGTLRRQPMWPIARAAMAYERPI